MELGQVVRAEDGKIGIVSDCIPMANPHSIVVAWEPLLGGTFSATTPDKVTVVPLRASEVPV